MISWGLSNVAQAEAAVAQRYVVVCTQETIPHSVWVYALRRNSVSFSRQGGISGGFDVRILHNHGDS